MHAKKKRTVGDDNKIQEKFILCDSSNAFSTVQGISDKVLLQLAGMEQPSLQLSQSFLYGQYVFRCDMLYIDFTWRLTRLLLDMNDMINISKL